MEEKVGSLTIDWAPTPTPAPEHDPWAGVFTPKEVPMADKRPEIKMKALKTFMSDSGTLLRADAEYVLHSENVALQHVQKKLGDRVSPEAPKGEEGGEQETVVQATVAEDEPWKLQIDPEAYLEKWPEGPNAPQAKAEIARRRASATD